MTKNVFKDGKEKGNKAPARDAKKEKKGEGKFGDKAMKRKK